SPFTASLPTSYRIPCRAAHTYRKPGFFSFQLEVRLDWRPRESIEKSESNLNRAHREKGTRVQPRAAANARHTWPFCVGLLCSAPVGRACPKTRRGSGPRQQRGASRATGESEKRRSRIASGSGDRTS